ncbi:hypothetical protein RvY_00004 [Ramazzottius varieornatus]|uniref:RIB43A-like with coiled-coils protein 2 n=1 Tax=Ramazzottius varieornatus TaxID=947166 RepID=A0A1D1UBL6_RAMVA|nr:hypothetical protein RvY_00004 [Ramazzottius varieornatus]
MFSKNADSYKLDDNRLSGQTIYRTNPTQQEVKWERMKDTLKARRSRILDPVISKLPKEDLDEDVCRLQELQAQERQESIREGQKLRLLDNKHKFLENVVRAEKINEAKRVVAFRQEFQLPQQRRDYDLYDPHRWKSEPLVTYQNPEVQGPAAMMNFEGYKLMDTEGNLEADRRKYQREMLDLQTREDAVRQQRLSKIDELQQEIAATIANKAEDDQRRGELLKKAQAVDNAHQNEAMFQNRALQRQASKLDEARAAQDDIYYWTSGKLLDPQPNKVDIARGTDWRGLSRAEQLANFTGPKSVCQQVYQKRQKEAEEAERERRMVQQSKVQERLVK